MTGETLVGPCILGLVVIVGGLLVLLIDTIKARMRAGRPEYRRRGRKYYTY